MIECETCKNNLLPLEGCSDIKGFTTKWEDLTLSHARKMSINLINV
jgi:hypothetical protein